MSERTLPQSLDILRQTLCDYIEASYHIRDPNLIEQRRALLKTPGVIAQVPYVETLPQYTAAKEGFLDTAWLPEGAAQAFQALNAEGEDMGVPLPKRIFHPHRHQYEAVQLALGAHPDHAGERRSFVVTTGTGSGKTECFLLPILATLAQQAWEGQRGKAASAQKRWEEAAVRVIVLYPMNALVNDQLGRMRQWLGDPRLVSLFCDRWKLSRPLRFGRYTGRSLYPGVRRHVVRKDGAIERLKSGRPKFLVRDARR
ncbi:MAG TPA: DEAD/DEAH box helicase, partial [Myxococcota bacterium]|nr:DEAD/DEAH box helicase [Myxococcota bacterium]